MLTSLLTSKVAVWFLETAWPFLVKNWKSILWVSMAIWIIVCCLSHCGTRRPVVTENTVIVSDTVEILDTTWHKLLGDTIAYYTAQLAEKRWEAPTVELTNASTCADSLDEYRGAFEWALVEIDDCDSTYRTDYRFRNYSSIIETDSFKLDYSIDVRGKLASEPVFAVQNLIPQKTITNTVTNTVVIEPRRKIFIGFGAGGQGNAIENNFQGVLFKSEVSYSDKKNNQFELEGQYTSQNLYGFIFTYKRGFDVGK